MESLERSVGALLGLAAGDALGAPLAFLSPEQVPIKHGDVRDMIGGGWLDLRPGQGTDLAEMALVLAGILAEADGLDRLDVAMRYVEIYERGGPSLDNVTQAALGAIASGTAVGEASRAAVEATGEDGRTNAPLVRALPLALRFPRDDAALIAAVESEASITHAADESRAAAAIAALFLARLLRGASGFDAVFEEVEAVVRSSSFPLPDVLSPVRDMVERDLRDSGDAVDTLERALFSLYWCESLEDAVLRSVRRGGAAPVTGAITGSLAGAFFGVSSIPDRWLRVLERRRAIEATARRLHERASAPGAAR